MKDKYIVTNLSATVQRLQDEEGQCLWLAQNEPVVMTNPPEQNYIWKVEKVSNETIELTKVTRSQLLDVVEMYVKNRKVLTKKEWKELGNANYTLEAWRLYNSLEAFTLNNKVLTKSEFEKLKTEQNNEKEVRQ